MDKLKILQWNCRGLKNEINDIDILCVNEVKNGRKQDLFVIILLQQKLIPTVIMALILIKNNIVINQTKPAEKENDCSGKTLEILKLCFKIPYFGDFWIISVYNSPGKPLSLEKIFSESMTNGFVCGDFNSPHQELNCSYDSENGEKHLNLIDNGHFNLLNNGHHTYQSFAGKSKNMLDLHFCDSTVFTNFSNFEVSEDLGSDQRTTITTFNLKINKIFESKSEIDFRQFRENARKSYRSSDLWTAQYPGKDELNEFSSNQVEIIHKSLEECYVNKTSFLTVLRYKN